MLKPEDMTDMPALFWDVGGVVLSNGWDHAARAEAARAFGFDFQEFEKRHGGAESELETGALTLEAYLNRTVFFRDRPFTREQFKEFIFSQSRENKQTRVLLDDLAASRCCFLATLNNESKELNEFRIRKFDLARNFAAFFTSCYLRARKPDPLIYQLVLGITQRPPGQCIFIDDRPENLEPARSLGMRTIQFRSAAELRASLSELGLSRAFAGG
ncbi:MAG TPA: HAD-IA family hydrolase [Candidatus Acidoferrales bacterium]|nr:HAD-IA family hydrolase [Candidatus Acidoferrales bacterium]